MPDPTPSLPTVDIHYRRLPDRVTVFRQIVVEDAGDYVVTLLERAAVPKPVTAGDGSVILEPGAPVVWFTYRGRWHDVGRFHLADGTFTGVYANVLMPVSMLPGHWETTDLCLDVWLGAGGRLEVLDQDEFAAARRSGWLSPAAGRRAEQEAAALARAALAGEWPPPEVRHWTLERAREAVSRAAGGA
jgi:predicted RNA-binding protein associated with RNAse of E/G family